MARDVARTVADAPSQGPLEEPAAPAPVEVEIEDAALGHDPQVAPVDAHGLVPPAGVDRPALQYAFDPPAPPAPDEGPGRAGERMPDDNDGRGKVGRQ